MKKILALCALLTLLAGTAWSAPVPLGWRGDIRHVVERDGVTYSLFVDRTRLVDDCIPGAEQVLETYVHLVFPAQNLVEIQQWNIRLDGSEYRVQDMFDYALDTFGMFDQ
jgi:hypothetical protein